MTDAAPIVEQFTAAIEATSPADFAALENRILDSMDAGRLSMLAAHRLLVRLRLHVFGGPGLSCVTHDGEVVPVDMAKSHRMTSVTSRRN